MSNDDLANSLLLSVGIYLGDLLDCGITGERDKEETIGKWLIIETGRTGDYGMDARG